MPRPTKHPKTGVYQYRQRVPSHLLSKARDKVVSVTIDGLTSSVKIGAHLKVSLRTKDPTRAKELGQEAQAQFDLIWASFATGPVSLTQRQCVGLARDIYTTIVALFEDHADEPPAQHLVHRRKEAEERRKAWKGGPFDALKIGRPRTLRERWGTWVDGALADQHIEVDQKSYERLLTEFDRAFGLAVDLIERRADGDFSPDPNASRFPVFEPLRKDAPRPPQGTLTFGEIVAAQVAYRALGVDAKPMPGKSVKRYSSVADEFAAWREVERDNALSVSSPELEAWRDSLLASGEVVRRTVHHKVGIIKTVINWGKARFKQDAAIKEKLRAIAADLKDVELPDFEGKSSEISAIYMEEAPVILRAARVVTDPRIRWLPWMCAYSGLRISEAAKAKKEDFFESEGLWFFSVSASGGRSLKTASSRRNVPVHPALLEEGLRDFVEASPAGPLFARGASVAVIRWFHRLGGMHQGVAPNHGWRHLFEDLCYRDGVSDGARLYLAGRATGKSDQMYGKTRARLPGLWEEIAKIKPINLDTRPQDDAAMGER